jgi:hypothetical protein
MKHKKSKKVEPQKSFLSTITAADVVLHLTSCISPQYFVSNKILKNG